MGYRKNLVNGIIFVFAIAGVWIYTTYSSAFGFLLLAIALIVSLFRRAIYDLL